MRPLASMMLAASAAACSVAPLSLEGKQCPCAAGYVCDMLTNRCLATNDGGVIIDSPAATQCLPPVTGEVELYRYSGTFDWQQDGGTWDGNTTEIRQTSTSAQGAFAYTTNANLTSAPDYRVVASMREITPGSGTPALGIVLRTKLADNPRYACEWSSKARQLQLLSYGSGGGTVLAAASVAGTLPTSITMEAAVDGAALSCCIREIASARLLDITDAAMTRADGYPGVTTNRMEAAFGSFVVFQRP